MTARSVINQLVPATNDSLSDRGFESARRAESSASLILRVLEELAVSGELGITDLARRMGLPKSTAHRLVSILVDAGLAAQQDSNHKYRVATKFLVLADAVRSRSGARDIVHSCLTDLATQTHETANLGVLRDGNVVYLDTVGAGELYTIGIRVGSIMPAYCTALGKSILAFLPEDEMQSYVSSSKLVKLTRKTVVSPQVLLRELRRIRRSGVAVDDGELLEDICCLAAPVLAPDGRPIAAVSVSSPRSRFQEKKAATALIVSQGAARLSDALRYADTSALAT